MHVPNGFHPLPSARVYLPFDQPHLGLGTNGFDGPMLIEDIFYLGDTRSADDLAVFTGMPPERLCLGCVIAYFDRGSYKCDRLFCLHSVQSNAFQCCQAGSLHCSNLTIRKDSIGESIFFNFTCFKA